MNMKSKTLSLLLVIMVIGSLYGGLSLSGFIKPPTPVSAATGAWSTVNTPSQIGWQLLAGSDIDFLAVAPDGNTMFAYDNTAQELYKSTDAGNTWTTTNIGGTLEGNQLMALAISPDYGNDSQVIAATATKVYRSVNGGATFGEVGNLSSVSGVDGVDVFITSLDISPHYLGDLGGTEILVGTLDTDSYHFGGIFRFTTSGLAWVDLQVGNAPAGVGTGGMYDVLAVAFSPNHTVDAQYIAVATDEIDLYVKTKFGADNWDSGIMNAQISLHVPTSAVIAFPDDYEWSSNNKVLIGTAGAPDNKDDVYVVSGALPGGMSHASDKNVGGTGTSTDIHSIAMKGNYVDGKVLVGRKASRTVKRTADITASTVSWSSNTKSPTGGYPTIVAWSPTNNNAYAATSGAGSAFSRSTDGGATWNQVSLIDVSAIENLHLVDTAIVDDNTMFLLMWDDADASSALNTGDYSMLFKSIDGGSTWEQIWAQRSYGQGMTILALSPGYATDSTLFIAQNDTRIWKTANGGSTYTGLTAPADITAMYAVDGSSYYVGCYGGDFYKSGRWNAADTSDNVVSIDIADDGTIFVGTNDGDVLMSTDDGLNFTRLGTPEELGDNSEVIVTLDHDYATNSTIYAGSSDATKGLSRWVVGSSSAWEQIDDDGDTLVCTGVAVFDTDDSLYAASRMADKGVRRSQEPAAVTPVFDSFITNLPADSSLLNLKISSGSDRLYAIADLDTSDDSDETGVYGYEYRLLTYTDTEVQINLNLTINIIGNGATSPAAGVHTYLRGEEVNLTATPDPGWEFSGWSGAITEASATALITIDSDKEVTATFTQLGYGLTVSSTEGGTVTAPGEGTYTHTYGEVVNLVATAHKDYYFTGWTGDVTNISDSSASITTITINAAYTISASFAQVTGQQCTPGDANLDGELNALDITKTERLVAGID